MALLLNQIGAATCTSWMKAACTFYADDGHLFFFLPRIQNLNMVFHVLDVLDVLADLGMIASLSKSAVLLEG